MQFLVLEVPTAQVSEDQPVQLKVENQHAIAVYRVDEKYYAIDDVCTHEFAYLSEGYCADGIIECPLHQARFDVRTGATLGPPASIDLATYRIEVCNGVVRVFVPARGAGEIDEGRP
jgi:nitrite reductase/ring-hydroxylating ferredoxin subunit